MVRGEKMKGYPSLFDEFAAALQFPWYFGENTNAFDECITDLAWIPPGSGYVLVVTSPADVLADTESSALGWLVASLARAQDFWSQPVEQGEWWDRGPVPFHVVLHRGPGTSAAVAQRWRAAGAAIEQAEA